jgi:hypothetical protein
LSTASPLTMHGGARPEARRRRTEQARGSAAPPFAFSVD